MVLELMTPSGLLLRRDAIASGYDDKHLLRLVKRGDLIRIRQGAYASSVVWQVSDEPARHALLSEAVLLQYDDHVALSHDSACLAHGGPNWRLDLGAVHLTHFHGGGRTSAGLVHHNGACHVTDVTKLPSGHWVTSPARTVLDVATRHGVDVGVVVADDFLHRKLTSPDELRMCHDTRQDWPHGLAVRLVLDLADGRSESVGETLWRGLCRRMRLPRPELQWHVYDHNGLLIGRTDVAWPRHGLLGEFDGKSKYMRLRREGETIEETVMREKAREDRLREITGWQMIRVVWADLFRPEQTAARIRRLMRRAA